MFEKYMDFITAVFATVLLILVTIVLAIMIYCIHKEFSKDINQNQPAIEKAGSK